MTVIDARAMGTPVRRVEGPDKVTGTARYAAEMPVDTALHLHPVQATIARGRITAVDATAAREVRSLPMDFVQVSGYGR